MADPSAGPEVAHGSRGLLDTSVLIDLDRIDPARLPEVTAISAITLAELSAGPHAAREADERGRRQDRLQWASSKWDPLPCDAEVARAYGRVYAMARKGGRRVRRRFADLLISATALAHGLPLYTRNPADFRGLETLIDIHGV